MKKKSEPSLNDKKGIILLVPGETEYEVLPVLLSKFGIKVGRPRVTRGISYNETSKEVIVPSSFCKQVRAALVRNPAKIVLIFDREQSRVCPGEFAAKVQDRIRSEIKQIESDLVVVCSDHCIENWILANPAVFKCKLFKKDLSQRVSDRSDCKNAIDIIAEGFGRDKHYDKTRHLPQIARQFDIHDKNFRQRSPSFDKFLREVGL